MTVERAPIPVLLITGQSSQYHDWRKTSAALGRALDAAGVFVATVVTAPDASAAMPPFLPDLEAIRAVVLDYDGPPWHRADERTLEEYVAGGGGLVIVHATNNAFPTWTAFLEMTGIGGWAGRDESWGPKVRWRDGGMVLDDSPGRAQHPPLHEFDVITRAPEHPIMRGLPPRWRHASDELYSQLRGPAKHIEVLATASADPGIYPKATGEHEPVLMTIQYGAGRVFHTTLGHAGPADTEPVPALSDMGFVTTFQRGTEWAATGMVTQPAPEGWQA